MRIILFLVILASTADLHAEDAASQEGIDFAHEVVPILKHKCGKCHTGNQKEGGFSTNTRETLLQGGESGPAIIPGDPTKGTLLARVSTDDEFLRMPPEGDPLTPDELVVLRQWVADGVKWEPGFTFGLAGYEPPLKPRRIDLPPVVDGRSNPIDRILDNQFLAESREFPQPISDAAFLRRASLDLIGLLPTPEEQAAFLADSATGRRERLVQSLLDREIDYAEHWLTFWNDLLRNDYAGTGFITGGRKQISKWLYESLVGNKPYDQFVRELIAPTPESEGFALGIRWRGEVSVAQTPEIQFAQNIGQAFLGINLKCASCHDSFIDRWKLEDAYALAAVYSTKPLELHRCDKPLGQEASPAWIFPELGQIDAAAPQPERLRQLASLMTDRENGRFTRTIVNRLWHQMMGRGIVHPTDAMQSEPWNADLLDFLAEHLVDSGYDLKKTLELIATSQAYQSEVERAAHEASSEDYRYMGPRAKRMTAEQFMDSVWQLTSAAPTKIDAPFIRGQADEAYARELPVTARWIWSQEDAAQAKAGETIAFRKTWHFKNDPSPALAVVSCDNSYTVYLNGKRLHAGDNWKSPDLLYLDNLRKGENEILVVAQNAGSEPNPAGLFLEARFDSAEEPHRIVTDDTWQWSKQLPPKSGKYEKLPEDWQPAAEVDSQSIGWNQLDSQMALLLSRGPTVAGRLVRASLLRSDFLMRSLGRPNRDQIVSVRPSELTTLQAIDLSNGEALAKTLRQGAENLMAQEWNSSEEFIDWTYSFALSRKPTEDEQKVLLEVLGDELSRESIEDALWSIIMLPEFQLIR